MTAIEIRISGLDDITAKLNALGIGLPNLTMLVAETVRGQTVDRFNIKHDPSGTPWAPLKPSTVAQKRKGGGILVESARLMNSITSDVVGLEARIGTNVFYSVYHQTGTKHMPAREIFGLEGGDLQECIDVIEAFIADVLQ
ncbi:phage virion morphogenesis protein [Chelatococcus asaccharovorans]|uniref:Phage virion morphogenesis protein n=1 Tax=Chelatococcus asaccharovorans TaxID=28210 RepID=A0A2V3UB26_9HYPH|nr:phage virion morphogenesis protein [Chelatococcus asaccharovorans]MBS7703314.1 phage virion morphogenesis protein [Chelatococcus asaccharovorans]PXW61647.1 phage virion morphogenesis protein [Chelatococcus asaccharovorans]